MADPKSTKTRVVERMLGGHDVTFHDGKSYRMEDENPDDAYRNALSAHSPRLTGSMDLHGLRGVRDIHLDPFYDYEPSKMQAISRALRGKR